MRISPRELDGQQTDRRLQRLSLSSRLHPLAERGEIYYRIRESEIIIGFMEIPSYDIRLDEAWRRIPD
jgi:hypothetical protein